MPSGSVRALRGGEPALVSVCAVRTPVNNSEVAHDTFHRRDPLLHQRMNDQARLGILQDRLPACSLARCRIRFAATNSATPLTTRIPANKYNGGGN